MRPALFLLLFLALADCISAAWMHLCISASLQLLLLLLPRTSSQQSKSFNICFRGVFFFPLSPPPPLSTLFPHSEHTKKRSRFISAATGLGSSCGIVASVRMRSRYSNCRKLPRQCDGCERNYCCLLSLHKKKRGGWGLSTTKTHWGEKKKDCCLCSSLLIAVKCPHGRQCSAGRSVSFSC